jgi:hypothetical protein
MKDNRTDDSKKDDKKDEKKKEISKHKFDPTEVAYIEIRESELGERVPVNMKPEIHKHIYDGTSGGRILRRISKDNVKELLKKITPYQLLQLKRHKNEFRIFEASGGVYYVDIEYGVPYVKTDEFLSIIDIEYYKLKPEHQIAIKARYNLKLKEVAITMKGETLFCDIIWLECGLQMKTTSKDIQIYVDDTDSPVMLCAWCTERLSKGKWNKCSGCCSVVYCNAVCQKNHWPKHKKTCKILQQQEGKEQDGFK